jgi:tRNA A37 threonylcarbamoyltransferase TsaD
MREVTVQINSKHEAQQEKGARNKLQLRKDISVADAAASFQCALVETLVQKTVRAAKLHNVNEIWIGGGRERQHATTRQNAEPLRVARALSAPNAVYGQRGNDRRRCALSSTSWDAGVV